jgi:hypothetical protein
LCCLLIYMADFNLWWCHWSEIGKWRIESALGNQLQDTTMCVSPTKLLSIWGK